MTTIWKFALAPIQDELQVQMPNGARLLHVGLQSISDLQRDALWLWALVRPAERLLLRRIRIYKTGDPGPASIERAVYVGSVQQGAFVWHVFDGGWAE